jgi:hypothetical protein
MAIWLSTFFLAIIVRAAWIDPPTLYIWGGLVLVYFVINFILNCRHPNSFRRRFAIGSWAEPWEPILHIREEIEIDPLEAFIDKHNQEFPDHKITMTAIFARALGEALSRTGKTYGKISFGQFIPLKSVDIALAVDINGEDLASLILRSCNTNTITQLAGQMRASVKPLKEKRDPKFNQQVSSFRGVPSFLIHTILRFLIWLNYDVGLPIPCLHLPSNGFGGAILTNVAGFMVRDTFAPLVQPFRTVATSLMNRPVERAVVRDGQIVIRKIMYFNTTFDHRFADGSDADKMIRALHEVFNDPAKYLWEAGFKPLL